MILFHSIIRDSLEPNLFGEKIPRENTPRAQKRILQAGRLCQAKCGTMRLLMEVETPAEGRGSFKASFVLIGNI